MIVLALDPAQRTGLNVDPSPRLSNRGFTIMGVDLSPDRTGVAIWDLTRAPSSMEARSIHTKTLARQRELFILDAFFDAFLDLLLECRPDFLSIEAPRQDIQMFTKENGERVPNPESTLPVNQIYGNARGAMRAYIRQTGCPLPFETVAVATWRKELFGFARKKGMSTPKWKEKARTECRDRLKVSVRNGDEAEAVLLALYAPRKMQTLKLALNRREAA